MDLTDISDFSVFAGLFVIFHQASRRRVPISVMPRGVCAVTEKLRRFAPGMTMMRHRLRLFTGEEDSAQDVAENVTVKLADISRALQDATRWNRTWLSDFADDEIQVSSDLYEILSTYMRLRPGA